MANDLYNNVSDKIAKYIGQDQAIQALERSLVRCGSSADGFTAAQLSEIAKFLVAAVQLAADDAKADALNADLKKLT